MKKTLFATLCFMLLASVVWAGTFTATSTLDWNGMDKMGNTEGSLPVTFTLHDAITGAVLSEASVNGPVTGFQMPSFVLEVPDNTVTSFSFYARARDAAGNVSDNSVVREVSIKGNDTLSPTTPTINVTISPIAVTELSTD